MDDALKVFAWEGDGVLTDYTNGLVVVVARSEYEAWTRLAEKDDTAEFCLRRDGKSPTCYAMANAPVFLIWGGG